jgi:small subunit ribosomal protein S9
MADRTKYFEAVGRRKTARARVRLISATTVGYEVNTKKLEDYFPTEEMRELIRQTLGSDHKFRVSAKVSGGGVHAQAEALKHAIARALCIADPSTRAVIKKTGALSRDSRAKERRKFGLKKARKAPQWSKR